MEQIVHIERMGYGADAIGHLDTSKTVFVEGGVPGDEALLEVIEEKKSFARARIVKLIEPSSARIPRPRGLPASIAPWGDMSYEMQLTSKEANVASALARTAHLGDERAAAVLAPIVGAPRELGYRNKVEMAVSEDRSGRLQLGFHDDADSIVPFTEPKLAIAEKPIEKAPKALAGALRYILGDDDLGLHRVGIRGSSRTNSIEVALWTRPCAFPRNFAAKVLQEAVGATSVVRVVADEGPSRKVKQVEVLSGDGHWDERMDIRLDDGGEGAPEVEAFRYKVSAPSFFQVNTPQACALVSAAIDALGDVEDLRIADLYSGVGTFSIPLAALGADVCAIELAGSSVRDLERACRLNEVGVDVICDDAARAFPVLGKVDAVIVDPPRSGLTEEAIGQLADAASCRLVYVSCDPQTLARDVARLGSAGFTLDSARPFDMFPQTWHVETVAVFSRDFC